MDVSNKLPPEPGGVERADVAAVDADAAGLHVVEPEETFINK